MSQPTPQDQMARMITGYWTSQMVHVAAKLRLADHLAAGPRTPDELAAATDTHARSLYRLLRALASVGLFSEAEDGRFTQTALSESLRKDVPRSQWAMAVMMGEEHYHAWGDLLESVRTGETAFDRLYGKPVFEYLGEHPEQAEVFDAAMTAIHGRETQATLDAYDFSGVGVLADIGGGNGTDLIGILGRYPGMRGVLFDLPTSSVGPGRTSRRRAWRGAARPWAATSSGRSRSKPTPTSSGTSSTTGTTSGPGRSCRTSAGRCPRGPGCWSSSTSFRRATSLRSASCWT